MDVSGHQQTRVPEPPFHLPFPAAPTVKRHRKSAQPKRSASGFSMIVTRRSRRHVQYQSTMDAPFTVAHCFRMESSHGTRAPERPLLSIVDDDESVRESLPDLLGEFGFTARAFSSAEEFLSSDCVHETRCLLIDVTMPRMSGPELQEELKRRGQQIPIVFITAQRDESIRARVLKQGASGFLLKPFSDTALLAALNRAMETH